MTSSPPIAEPPSRVSLASYGLRVAGPRDFAINLVLNAVIAGWICRHVDKVPITGGFSIAVMWGIMVWIVGACATFFGVRNGMLQRKRGRAGEPLPTDAPWIWFALLLATITCWSYLALFSLLFRSALPWIGATMAPVWLAVGGQALLAASVGYAAQVSGVVAARWLRAPLPVG